MDGGPVMSAFPEGIQGLVDVAATYSADGAPYTAADRLSLAAERLRERAVQCGYPAPITEPVTLKPIDQDIEALLENLGIDTEINGEFDCGDGEMSALAASMETTARRLVREAGYALPETPRGA